MTYKSDIIQNIKNLLQNILYSTSDITCTGIINQAHQLRIVLPENENQLEFWDTNAFEHLETIVEKSPKNPVDSIFFKFDEGYCNFRPLSKNSYWVLIFVKNVKLGIPPPYDRWQHEITALLSQLDVGI